MEVVQHAVFLLVNSPLHSLAKALSLFWLPFSSAFAHLPSPYLHGTLNTTGGLQSHLALAAWPDDAAMRRPLRVWAGAAPSGGPEAHPSLGITATAGGRSQNYETAAVLTLRFRGAGWIRAVDEQVSLQLMLIIAS